MRMKHTAYYTKHEPRQRPKRVPKHHAPFAVPGSGPLSKWLVSCLWGIPHFADAWSLPGIYFPVLNTFHLSNPPRISLPPGKPVGRFSRLRIWHQNEATRSSSVHLVSASIRTRDTNVYFKIHVQEYYRAWLNHHARLYRYLLASVRAWWASASLIRKPCYYTMSSSLLIMYTECRSCGYDWI